MIISASRRTDIPAYFSEWFINRVKAGYCYVRNPMNPKYISKVSLEKKDIEAIVFWTKNPQSMLDKLHYLDGYNYYFHFTINPYDLSIEGDVPKKSILIKTFQDLSNRIGKEKVIWRYTPILYIDGKIDLNYHKRYFVKMLDKIGPYTDLIKIGALEMYEKTKRNAKIHGLKLKSPPEGEFVELAEFMLDNVKKFDLRIERCVEHINLDSLGIYKGSCIDNKLISQISGYDIVYRKDRNQRGDCNCIESVDIGMYHSCPHKCVYCYANTSFETAEMNYARHNPKSPLLFGELTGNENIKERKLKSLVVNKTLF